MARGHLRPLRGHLPATDQGIPLHRIRVFPLRQLEIPEFSFSFFNTYLCSIRQEFNFAQVLLATAFLTNTNPWAQNAQGLVFFPVMPFARVLFAALGFSVSLYPLF